MEELLKIQSELKAPKNQYNSFGKYKYRSAEDILEAVKPLLSKYKCTLILKDEIKSVNDILFVESRAILRNSKDIIVEATAQAGIDVNKKGMDISQTFGSSSSYARKYALNGLFLIDDTKDADTTNTHGKDKQWLNKGSDEFKKAVKYLKNGGSLDKIETKYRLSKETKDALITEKAKI